MQRERVERGGEGKVVRCSEWGTTELCKAKEAATATREWHFQRPRTDEDVRCGRRALSQPTYLQLHLLCRPLVRRVKEALILTRRTLASSIVWRLYRQAVHAHGRAMQRSAQRRNVDVAIKPARVCVKECA